MGTRLYIKDESLEKICELLGLEKETAQLYTYIKDLEKLVSKLEESELKEQIGKIVCSLYYVTPSINELEGHLTFGFGRVVVSKYFEEEDWYDGSTSDPKIVKSLLRQVGQRKLVGKVKNVSWG